MSDLTATIDAHLAGYCEPDPETRRSLLGDAWATEGRLVDPPLEATGPDGIATLVDALLELYPGHHFTRTSAVDAHHDVARYEWALIAPDGSTALTGLDVATVGDDGRLTGVAGFFGPIPTEGKLAA